MPASILSQARRAGLAKTSPKFDQERAVEIADLCCDAGVPEMTRDLVLASIFVDEARRRALKVKASREARAMSRASMERIIRRRGEEPVRR